MKRQVTKLPLEMYVDICAFISLKRDIIDKNNDRRLNCALNIGKKKIFTYLFIFAEQGASFRFLPFSLKLRDRLKLYFTL